MKLGHVHLKVRSLEAAEEFYTELLGLKVVERVGEDFLFLNFGASHHDLALQSIGKNAAAAPAGAVGLFHVAFEADDAQSLLLVIDKLAKAGAKPAMVDYGISWAVYTSDPDGNGVEIFLDRRKAGEGATQWKGRTARLSREDVVRVCT